MILLWALRQRRGARHIAHKYAEYGWTTYHGHFIQMGGFVLVDGDDELSTESSAEELGHIKNSEEEISEDKLTPPALNTSLAPPVPEAFVEVDTGAPLVSESSEGGHLPEDQTLQPLAGAHQGSTQKDFESALVADSKDAVQSTSRITSVIPDELEKVGKPEPHESPSVHENERFTALPKVLGFPKKIVLFILRRLDRMRAFRKRSNMLKTPTFYAFPTTSKHINRQSIVNCSVIIIVSAIFGLIHCGGWSFAFPSIPERTLWRVCAITITIVPIVAVGLHLVACAFKLFKIHKKVPWVYLVTGRIALNEAPVFLIPREAFHGFPWKFQGVHGVKREDEMTK
ncbi:hypothetical protein M413DRAFT_422382 [Hebeloma cylindrosporum]|uniref:Uncharacterized protein n=1 Tax=Hebeloma cylindrosporum TaxID=76867 RepID=A0A0C2Z136_HEBCY|nr:hypothetical protein M413DRAFT_422382 [Hebeloma cylindrosporum h7]